MVSAFHIRGSLPRCHVAVESPEVIGRKRCCGRAGLKIEPGCPMPEGEAIVQMYGTAQVYSVYVTCLHH